MTAASSAAPLSADAYMSALKLCTRQLCVGFATSCATVGEDVALLTDKIPAVGRHAVLSVCWNSDDPVGHHAFHEQFGQYFVDPAAKFNSAPVWRGLDGTSFIHKCSDGTWRIGAGLDTGFTALVSEYIGGLTPPLQNWVCGVGGDNVPEVVVADTSVWAGVKVQHVRDVLRSTAAALKSACDEVGGTARAANPVYEVDGEGSTDLDLLPTDLGETRPKVTPKPRAAPKAPPRGSVAISSEPVRAVPIVARRGSPTQMQAQGEDLSSTAEPEDIEAYMRLALDTSTISML
jgi:hypothetical protein